MESGHIDWDSFFARYRAMALRCATGWSDRASADDLVQEAAQAVLERARREPPFDSEGHARNYFFRTLHNRAAERLRRPGRRSLSLDEVDDSVAPTSSPWQAASAAEDESLASVRQSALEELIDQLRPAQRDAIRLRYGEGLTLREISERTGTPLSTLGERIQAGLKKIRGKAGMTGVTPN